MTDEVVNIDVNFTIRPFTDESQDIFNVVAGVDPYILIEPVDDDGESQVTTFNLDSTGINKEELAWVLEAIAHTLKSGEMTL